MSEIFQPKNELEQHLLAAQEGQMDSETFMAHLMTAQVFMPVKDKYQIANFQGSDRAVPLSVTTEDGTEVLILFTSPERAKEFLKDFPGYEGGILTDLNWILEKMGVGYGISINPDWDVGIDLEPGMIEQLRGTPSGE